MLAVMTNLSDDWVDYAVNDVGGLDLLLSDAALGVLRLLRPDTSSVLRLGEALAQRPGLVLREAVGLGAELGRIAAGRSAVTAGRRDRRFAVPYTPGLGIARARRHFNPFFRRRRVGRPGADIRARAGSA